MRWRLHQRAGPDGAGGHREISSYRFSTTGSHRLAGGEDIDPLQTVISAGIGVLVRGWKIQRVRFRGLFVVIVA